ncbi:rhomboid-related protein 4 isoform X2 [Dermochelys coriacea]|uniref:rhomboid-related protein 4 isoform X2 n=1 Tax=Dermochelys coriacea TaxID=27794 RepID=UPI0018E716BE|nr:rhomboid-related protein 4 isoform X2 [Dermochelys coriacea]
MQRRRRGVDVGLILLLSQVFQVGLENIPPVTLGTLALNVFLFLKPLKPLLKVCISVDQSYYQKDWQRLLLAPVHHADDWHLYFNMVSLLWKGIKLERKLGSILFGYIIAVFSVLIGIVYIVLEYALAGLLNDPSYKMNCAVGFSGVLFALKVLNNHHHPGGTSNIMGIHVSSRYACWLELVAIHLCSPGTSFAGHLAGILVGLMYTLGPLKMLMKTTAGYSRHPSYPYNISGNYDMYTGGLTEEQQFERALRNSLRDRGTSNQVLVKIRISESSDHT